MTKKQAYLVYECEHGWCYQPARVPSVREEPSATFSFSKLSQLMKHLTSRALQSKGDQP